MRNPIALVLLSLGVLLVGAPGEAGRFDCQAGDVDCLIAAIHQSNANGEENTIVLAAGVYTLTAIDNDTDGPNGLPSIAGRLTIQGARASSTTIKGVTGFPGDSAGVFFRILHVGSAGVLTVRDLTVTGGSMPSSVGHRGAGIFARGSVTIDDSSISGNSAHAGGGGVDIEDDGTLAIVRSVISNNGGLFGGGVNFSSSGDLTISDTRVIRNAAGFTGSGGGLSISISSGGAGRTSTATITRSTIADNVAGGGGGIVANGYLTITQSAIVRNTAIFAGGVWFSGSSMTMTASTVANNASFGINSDVGTSSVTNSTIVGNAAGVSGDIRLQNSIVAGNAPSGPSGARPADCVGAIVSLGNNLIGDPSSCGTLLTSDLTGDPGLGSLIDPGRAGVAHVPLLAGSQAIDAGDNATCGAADQEGLARPIDGNGDGVRVCDIGAVEFYPVVNDLLRLDSLRAVYSPPSQDEQSNPLTAGGAFAISAVFTNVAAQDICHVAFHVTELRGRAGGTPTIVTRDGDLIGGEGIIVPATLINANSDLSAGRGDTYQFTVGLSQKEPITFLVNVVGDATSGSCGR